MASGDGGKANGRQLLVLLYHEIRVLARQHLSGERLSHTLNTTALVNELFLRVADSGQQFLTEGEFAAAASNIMRRILVDHARARNRQKRGGGQEILQLSGLTFEISQGHTIDVEALDEALTRLAQIDERQARGVELRFFGGLSTQEIADQLRVSAKTVKRDWATARSWLKAVLMP